MPDYEHKKIVETITRLDAPPSDAHAFAEWIIANAHLAFLRDNADADEVVVYASGEYTLFLICRSHLIKTTQRPSREGFSCRHRWVPSHRSSRSSAAPSLAQRCTPDWEQIRPQRRFGRR